MEIYVTTTVTETLCLHQLNTWKSEPKIHITSFCFLSTIFFSIFQRLISSNALSNVPICAEAKPSLDLNLSSIFDMVLYEKTQKLNKPGFELVLKVDFRVGFGPGGFRKIPGPHTLISTEIWLFVIHGSP